MDKTTILTEVWIKKEFFDCHATLFEWCFGVSIMI